MPSNSGAVHGARYNARLIAARVASTRFGYVQERPSIAPGDLTDLVVRELTEAPELWHQRGYLARVITADPEAGLVDDGVQPLTHVLDAEGGDALALTLEADGTGAIYPVIYTRVNGAITEQALEPEPLLRYDGPEARKAVAAAVDAFLPGVAAG